MLYREDTPLTPAEVIEFELQRHFNRLCESDAVLAVVDDTGGRRQPRAVERLLRAQLELQWTEALLETAFETRSRS